MAGQNSAPWRELLNGPTLLLATVFILPAALPSLFGWAGGLTAIPVFFILTVTGTGQGGKYIQNSALVAVGTGFLFNLLPSILFGLTLVPLAYSLSYSAARGDQEWLAGARGSLVLGATWLLFWFGYGAVHDFNPYQQLLTFLDTGFAQTYDYYLSDTELPVETVVQVEQAVRRLQSLVPKILPGILICTVITTVWLNMVGSAALINRLKPGQLSWKPYSEWRLPDQLVWVAVGAGILLVIGRGAAGTIGTGLALICSLVYFFQGLAVMLHLLAKWGVPPYLRILLYLFLVLQSYGLLLLTIVGLADIWFDFRNHNTDKSDEHGGS